MSDTMAALLILPTLFALVVVLECTRVGCSRVARRFRPPVSTATSAEPAAELASPLQSL